MAKEPTAAKRVALHLWRQARRQRASVRERARAQRSTAAQLALLDSRPGNSARERARLERTQ